MGFGAPNKAPFICICLHSIYIYVYRSFDPYHSWKYLHFFKILTWNSLMFNCTKLRGSEFVEEVEVVLPTSEHQLHHLHCCLWTLPRCGERGNGLLGHHHCLRRPGLVGSQLQLVPISPTSDFEDNFECAGWPSLSLLHGTLPPIVAELAKLLK